MLREVFSKVATDTGMARSQADLFDSHGVYTRWGWIDNCASKLIEIYSSDGLRWYSLRIKAIHPDSKDWESDTLALLRRLQNETKKWTTLIESLKEDLEAEWLSKTKKKRLEPALEEMMRAIRTFHRDVQESLDILGR